MIERYCAWHKPEPKLLKVINDGHLAVIRIEDICRECMQEIQRAELARMRSAGGISTSFARRAPSSEDLCASSRN